MMSGIQKEEVSNALLAAYNKASLTQMLDFRMEINLLGIVADGPLKTVVFDLLRVAEEEGWEVKLIREAYRFRSGNTEMLKIYEKYGLAPKIEVKEGVAAAVTQVLASGGSLERIIRRDNPLLDMGLWVSSMAEKRLRVCRVDRNDGAQGTGFLIGADLVLTNYHVIQGLVDGPDKEGAFSCLFGFEMLSNGQPTAGQRVRLHPDKGLLVYSPYTAAEKAGTPDKTLPTTDELDFALLRLERPVGSDKNGVGDAPRGWETLPKVLPALVPDQGIIIVQHPRGEPLKLAIDTKAVIDVNANSTRVRYRTNTEGGSSGSPVFDFSWNLVALHHYGDPAITNNPAYNQGVLPLQLIRQKIEAAGAGALLG